MTTTKTVTLFLCGYRALSDSGKDLVQRVPVHVGQAAFDAVVVERESFVVHAEQA